MKLRVLYDDGYVTLYQTRSSINILEYGIIIEEGFISDGASIPEFLYPLFDKENYLFPAIVHDWLYFTGNNSRRKSDRIFYELLRKQGVGYIRSNLMYLAVRIFGKKYYTNKRR